MSGASDVIAVTITADTLAADDDGISANAAVEEITNENTNKKLTIALYIDLIFIIFPSLFFL